MTLFVATHFALCGWLLFAFVICFWGTVWYFCCVAAPRTQAQRENRLDPNFKRVRP